MIFAWKSFVSDGVVIAEDINDAVSKMHVVMGINAQDFLLSEMIQGYDKDEPVYYSNQQVLFSFSEGVAREPKKYWEYCIRFEYGFPDDVVDYTLVRFTQPVPDERGMAFMKERYTE